MRVVPVTEHSFYAYLPMKMKQTVFRNGGISNSDAGELPRRKHTTYFQVTELLLKK
jgi:hypothetical protein